jgi:hypothetical protein
MKRAALLCLITVGLTCAGVDAQQAIPAEYGYKFAGQTPDAAYFLSVIRRGAEPESVQAWVWTVNHTPAAEADQHDAKAELAVMRCSGRTIEILKTELYHDGQLLSSTDELPMTPRDIRANTPMDLAWHVACDMDRRYSAQTVPDISAVYQIAR